MHIFVTNEVNYHPTSKVEQSREKWAVSPPGVRSKVYDKELFPLGIGETMIEPVINWFNKTQLLNSELGSFVLHTHNPARLILISKMGPYESVDLLILGICNFSVLSLVELKFSDFWLAVRLLQTTPFTWYCIKIK